MSILTGGPVILANETINRNNNNGGGKKNRDRNNRNNGGNSGDFGRSYENTDTDYALMGSTYVSDDIREELMKGRSEKSTRSDQQAPKQETKRDRRVEAILDFCDTFQDSVNDYRSLQEHVIAEFPSIVGYLRSYYNNDSGPAFVDAENRLIKLMSTSQFANVLGSVLQNGDWNDDGTYAKIWRSIAFALSVALETSHERMHAKVIQKYAVDILPRMWNPEINEMVRECGITKDLALDLTIAIPMVGGNWNGSSVDALYMRFLDKMLDHAENNMDVLNYEVQGMLYDKLFGVKNKTALNVIGKFLVSEPIKDLSGEVTQAVYKEFIKMLYTKLDEYDVDQIAYVFRYIVKCRKENPDRSTIFMSTDVKQYENVRKGMMMVLDENKDAMDYLA